MSLADFFNIKPTFHSLDKLHLVISITIFIYVQFSLLKFCLNFCIYVHEEYWLVGFCFCLFFFFVRFLYHCNSGTTELVGKYSFLLIFWESLCRLCKIFLKCLVRFIQWSQLGLELVSNYKFTFSDRGQFRFSIS